MSADHIAAAALGAGTTLLVMGALMVIALAYVYQGAHAARLDAEHDAERARNYHRLSPDERRIWRQTGGHPVVPADVQAAVDGSWEGRRA